MSGLSDDPCPPPRSHDTDQRNVETLAQTDDTKAPRPPPEELSRVAFAKLLGLTIFAVTLVVQAAIDPAFEMKEEAALSYWVRFSLLVLLFLAARDKGISHLIITTVFAIATAIIHIVGSPIVLGKTTLSLRPVNPEWIGTTFFLCYTVWQVTVLHQGQPITDSTHRLSKGSIEFRCYQTASAVCALFLTTDVVGIYYYLFCRALMGDSEILSVHEFGDLIPELSWALCWILFVVSFFLFVVVVVPLWLPLSILSEHITPVRILAAKNLMAIVALEKILKDGYSWGSLAKEIAALLADVEDMLGDFPNKKDVGEDTSAQGVRPSLGQAMPNPQSQDLPSQQTVVGTSTDSSVGESIEDEWEVVEGCTSEHQEGFAWTAGSAEQDPHSDDRNSH
ncbi:hypothetical protein MMC28_009139 [Mycoblastus sanguinarius]|nr:hypothetical protein [Mycoblastus sanguinarius]